MKKRILSMLLAIVMVVGMLPTTAFAATGDNLCDHHTEHTADCGYVAAVEGSPCAHAHDEACGYAEAVEEVLCACVAAEDGTLTHTEGCGYVAPVAGSECTHAHDEVCGYVEAAAEVPCGYVCEESHEEEPAACTHDNNTTVTVEATCGADGSMTVTCDDCGEVISTETYPATGAHSYENGVCTTCGASWFIVSGNTLTIDGTLGGNATATEEDITALVDAIQGYVDSGITTIIVTGETPAIIDMGSWTNTAIGEAIYRLSGNGYYDENNPYNGKIDLILSDVTEIVDQEFYGAFALNSITLPKVTTIGDGAFYDCRYLEKMTFGSVVTTINQGSYDDFHRVGENVDGCDLVLNCGQAGEDSPYIPDFTANTWYGTSNAFKSITLTHTEATAATCTAKATCSVCGEYGEVDANAHSYGDWESNGDGTHTRTCAYDPTHTENGTCSGGMATCTEPANCDSCGQPYGEPNSSNHGELTDWEYDTVEQHTRYCSLCGGWETIEYEDHSYENGVCTGCEDICDHSYENGSCTVCGEADPDAGPVITKQPQSVEVEIGKHALIYVEVEGDGLTYQWYYKDRNSTEFKPSVYTGTTYTMTMAEWCHGREVYCVITDENGNSITTETATMTRPPIELKILTQPQDVQVEIGERVTITVVAQGEGLTYQWYYKNKGGSEFAASCFKSKSYSMTMAEFCHMREVYCVITDMYGNQVTTDVATMTRPPQELKIITEPESVYTEIGGSVRITVEATGDGLTYQWYYKNAGDTEFKTSCYTGKTYSMTLATWCDGREVYCVITDQYGNVVQTQTAVMSSEQN